MTRFRSPSLARLALVFALTAAPGPASAQSRLQLVDSFIEAPGRSCAALSAAEDLQGALYWTGQTSIGEEDLALFVRRSLDGGVTWETTARMFEAGRPISGGSMSVDSQGRLYLTGATQVVPHVDQWTIWRSVDRGVTWSVIDRFAFDTGSHAWAYQVVFGADGTMYASGAAEDSAKLEHWIVRASRDDGRTWAVVDEMEGPRLDTSIAASIAIGRGPDGREAVFTSGWWSSTVNDMILATTRRSLDGGRDWTFADAYHRGPTLTASNRSVFTGADREVFTVGRFVGTDGKVYCMTRVSRDGGQNWATTDSYERGYASCRTMQGYVRGDVVTTIGAHITADGKRYPFIRESADRGRTWVTAYDAPELPGDGRAFQDVVPLRDGRALISARELDVKDGPRGNVCSIYAWSPPATAR